MPIVDKLKEALKPGRKETSDEGDLNKLLASSAKKVLLQKIEFEPASKGFSYQLDSLKNKYVILNPRNEGATGQKATDPVQIKRQGKLNWNIFTAWNHYITARINLQNMLPLSFSLGERDWQPERWDPRSTEDALSGEQAHP